MTPLPSMQDIAAKKAHVEEKLTVCRWDEGTDEGMVYRVFESLPGTEGG